MASEPKPAPKTLIAFVEWSSSWLAGPKTERIGQAFFNEFHLEFGNSYNSENTYQTLVLIEEGLAKMYPDFYTVV